MFKKERSLVSKNSNSFNDMIKRTSVSTKQRRKLSGNELLMTITISVVIIGAIFGLVAVGYEMTAFAAKPQENVSFITRGVWLILVLGDTYSG